MEATGSTATSAIAYQYTRCHSPEHLTFLDVVCLWRARNWVVTYDSGGYHASEV